MWDKYSKKPTLVTLTEGTASIFAQEQGKKGEAKKADGDKVKFDKKFYKDRE